MDHFDNYAKSKTHTEKTAWGFVELNPSIELVTINPGLMFGPNCSKMNFMTGDFCAAVLMGTMPVFTEHCVAVVDVRDCAMMHLKACQVPEAANKRFICVSECIWAKDLGKILSDKFPEYPEITKTVMGPCIF